MVKRNNDIVSGYSESFGARDDSILNYRPNISFVEPEQVPIETTLSSPPETTLDTTTDRTIAVINSLNAVVDLCVLVQKKVDAKVSSLGGVSIKLDPVKDFATISAMKRRFPDKTDPTTITYDDYRKALDCLGTSLVTPQGVSFSEIEKAQLDPLRTDFGGSGNTNGENRPELSSPLNIQPLDIPAFQEQAIKTLFATLTPMIIGLIKKFIPG